MFRARFVCIAQLGCHWKDFCKIVYVGFKKNLTGFISGYNVTKITGILQK